MGQNENGESEQPSGSDVGRSIALTNMTEEEIKSMITNYVRQIVKPIVISTVQQSIERIAEDVFRRVIKEEVQSFGKKGLAGESRNGVPKERSLFMMFVDEVSGPVKTSNELKGIRGDPLEVALFDATGHIVNSGPESSAKVEIVLIDASDDDDENIITHEKFERRIIKAGDKKKPYLSGNVYISLKRGVGSLIGLKLGHGKDWTNFCYCRLGVRLVQNFRGVTAQEGWTEPFKVIDKRGKQYGKHYPPFPGDDIWRLKKIARNGEPWNRLDEKNIKTVQDFRFWHQVNPRELQQKILQVGDSTWKAIVDHAYTCTMDEEKMYSHKSPPESQTSVIYDVVGKLKGVIYESQFIPIDYLPTDKKDHAHKLLSSVLDPSAFVKRYNTPFNYEEFRLQQQSDINASAICSVCPCSNCNDLTRSEYFNSLRTTGPSTSQTIIPNSNSYTGPSSLGPRDTRELCDPPSALFENIDGDPPTDLDNEKHCFLKSPLLEKHKADAQELSPPFNDMNYLHQMLISLDNPLDSGQSDCLGSRTSEMVGECSNASFHSVSSTMHSFGETGWGWCDDDNNDDQWGIRDDFPPGPPSPNPMYSYNTHMCVEPHADQGSTATAHEPQPVNTSTDPPNSWKRLSRLWFSFRKRMSLDVTRTHKKQKVR